MRASEQVAVLTALQKMVRERLAEVRALADDEMLEAYEADGVTKKALRVGGVKVGDFILATEGEHWEVTDKEALGEFALDYGFATVRTFIRPECMFQAITYLYDHLPEVIGSEAVLADKWQSFIVNAGGLPTFMDSGMVVPGIVFAPARPKGTQVRGCKPADVAPLLAGVGGLVPLLLGGAAESESTSHTELEAQQ